MFGSDALKKYDPRYTVKAVKHGGGSIKIWGCLSYYGVGPLFWIKENMNKEIYLNILQDVMLPFVEENLPLIWVYLQDNDPKHTAKVVKNWFHNEKIRILKWPAQSPNINLIENLWAHIKNELGKLPMTKNKDEHWKNIKYIWKNIPISTCQKLVDTMPKRCAAIIANKGYKTKC